jgi:hypothetical protein
MVLSFIILINHDRAGWLGRSALRGRNSKKRPENGSGRRVVGQIRGGSIDVNAVRFLALAPNSATFWLIWLVAWKLCPALAP